ncbi:hypothetical protein ACJX0J_018311, partial [Zea mays]
YLYNIYFSKDPLMFYIILCITHYSINEVINSIIMLTEATEIGEMITGNFATSVSKHIIA